MKLTSKIVTVVAASLMMVHVACPVRQKIVAYKAPGMDTTTESKITLIQKNNRIVSDATFKTGTDKSGAKFDTDPKKKYLYFETTEPLTIKFQNTANDVNAPITFYPADLSQPLGVGSILKNSKIRISGSSYPYKIEIDPPRVRVNVKNNMSSLPAKAKIYAIIENNNTEYKPLSTNVYDSILVSNLSTRKLKVPAGKQFWISIHDGKKMLPPSEIQANPVTTSSVITIDTTGKATLVK